MEQTEKVSSILRFKKNSENIHQLKKVICINMLRKQLAL